MTFITTMVLYAKTMQYIYLKGCSHKYLGHTYLASINYVCIPLSKAIV